jgi:hypothetical protein
MLNPHEIKTYAVSFSWDKNRYVTYFDNEYYLDENTALFRSSHNFNERRVIHSAFTRRQKIKSKPIRPSLKAGLVQIKWKSILGIKTFF